MTRKANKASPRNGRRSWWLNTARHRAEWQALSAAGLATFAGRPKARFKRVSPGDPVLLYLSKPDRALRAVGVVTRATRGAAALEPGANGEEESRVEVQLAFDLPNPVGWREIVSAGGLVAAEPVRQRSSGSLFALTPEEYEALRDLVVSRNPELEAAFAAVDSGIIPAEPPTADTQAPRPAATSLHEEHAPYSATEPSAPPLPTIRTLAELQQLTGLPAAVLSEAADLLEQTGQIVLSGPPGTGKTWLARGLAAFVARDPSRVSVAQFHPSTTYEDFIEGLKPQVDPEGHVTYAVVPGLFLRLCEEARRDPGQSYVVVIDEINRAPLARVFGELLYALEYRGPEGAVELSLSSGINRLGAPFWVPANLLIIGTMNAADRSLALVDYALRRRFRFVELEPSGVVLEGWLAEHGAGARARSIVLDLFAGVNARLAESLGPDHRLGHSYFMLDPLTSVTLDRLWRTAIRPLISEYYLPSTAEVDEIASMFEETVSALRRLES